IIAAMPRQTSPKAGSRPEIHFYRFLESPMICKAIKTVVLVGLGVGLVGGLLFGREAVSYFRSAVGSVRDVAKDNVPIEFELRRAAICSTTSFPRCRPPFA